MICSLIIGLIFGMALLVTAMLASGAFSVRKPTLIVYSDSNQKLYDGSALIDHGWDMNGTLKEGHQAKPVFRGSRTEAGESENTMELIITDEMGIDVTADYDIEYHFGVLTVEPRRVLVIGETGGMSDGVLDPASYQFSSDCDGLIGGHNMKIFFESGIADVLISNEAAEDVTKNYFIILQLDGNTFFPTSGNQTAPMYKIYSDVKDTIYLKINSYGDYLGQEKWAIAPTYDTLLPGEYSAAYLTSLALSLQKNNKPVTIQIESLCGYYALPYYMLEGDYQIQTSDCMYKGDVSDAYSVNYYRYPETTKNLATPYGDYEKAYRKFVYENYLKLDATSSDYMKNLIKKQGFSASDPDIIQKVASYIQNAAVYNLDYPKSLEQEENVAIAFLETYKEGVCRHYSISATLLFRALGIPARYCVGALAFVEAGQWTDIPGSQAHAWVEVYLDGIGWVMVEVTGGGVSEGGDSNVDSGAMTVKPVPSRFLFDRQSHTSLNRVTGLEKLEAAGYTYTVRVSGSRAAAGKTVTEIQELHIYSPDGQEVTDQYDLKLEKGILQVYYDSFEFSSLDIEKYYDGNSIETLPQIFYNSAQLAQANLTVNFQVSNDPVTDVGMHLNRFEVELYQNGQNVTDMYLIQYQFGTLNIKSNSITIQAADAEKVYDGTELVSNAYQITAGVLLEGHYIDNVVYSGSQTNVGRSDNNITYIAIYDQNGNNVTKNYSVTLLPGKLKVTRPK